VSLKIIAVDVSALAPPEPMSIILGALATLPAQHALKVNHRREPFPLYQRLIDNGWHYHTRQKSSDRYLIYIVKALDSQALTDYLAYQ
jgi:hypothetical protein